MKRKLLRWLGMKLSILDYKVRGHIACKIRPLGFVAYKYMSPEEIAVFKEVSKNNQ